jgi:acyl dehydratase
MHHDPTYTAGAGLEGTVVDGQMLGALLAEQLLDHFGPRAFLRELDVRFRAMVFAGETVRCEGEVTDVAEGAVRTSHRVVCGDRVAADGTATVLLRA